MSTPNMNLTLAVVSSTLGPEWASTVNTAFDDIDAHDHTASHGVQVPSAGININADLGFNARSINNLTSLRLVSLSATPTAPSDLRVVYSKNGELTYRDASGNEVQLTQNGSVAGASGSISGLVSPASASYNTSSKTFFLDKDTSKRGKLAISDILLYEFDNASANSITIKSPASLASSYSITMPAATPATDSALMLMSSAGVLSTLVKGAANTVLRSNSGGTDIEYATIDTTNITDGAITPAKKVAMSVSATAAAGQMALSSASGTVTRTSSAYATVVSCTLTTTGRPVATGVTGAGSGAAFFYLAGTGEGKIRITCDSNTVAEYRIQSLTNSDSAFPIEIPSSAVFGISTPTAGAHTYALQFAVDNGSTIKVGNSQLYAYEL